ncbi:siderophore ABC transporter substrate-binding protein [Planktotalea sp.]|uniref:siderophore ABC transporter substrate-binding protein n=1 Tax=Planktotalea sp. TaxID=2029877 RepID=UPI00329803C7
MFRTLSFLLLILAAPVTAQNAIVETYRGESEVKARPRNVAVFDFAAFDTLSALGVKVQGLARPVYLPYLEDAADGTTPIGSLFEPDFEALFAMQPDLIIAGGRSSEQVSELAKIAPTLDMTIWEDTVGQGLARLAAYGTIFDKQMESTSLLISFADKLEKTKSALAGKGTALIVMTNGPKVSAYGIGGRFGWLHSALNLAEAVPSVEQSTHGEAISFEFIRDANPDILIVIDRMAAIGQDGASAQSTLDNALVHETNAWKTGRVIYLSSAPVYLAGGGIQSMSLTLDEIQTAIRTHP